MATNPDPKADPKAAAPKTSEVKTTKAQYIRAVHGRMVDPLTALEYNVVPSELFKRTSWVDSQIEAKKLELCDPPDTKAAA